MTTEALVAADQQLKKSHAYEAFSEVLSVEAEDQQTCLALFLADATRFQRAALLASMADRDYQIVEPALIESVRRLLTHDDQYLRRMAALALFSAGDLAHEALSEEMQGKLPKEIALDLVQLFRLASGVG